VLVNASDGVWNAWNLTAAAEEEPLSESGLTPGVPSG
jgi:hypothetical protein